MTTASAGIGFSTSFTGSELVPALVACALASIAGAVAVVATRGVARRLLGVVLAVVAVVIVVTALQVLADPTGASRSSLSLVAGGAAAATRPATCAWWWCLLAAAGGVTALCGACLTALHGSSWPVMGARFEAPAQGRVRRSAAADAWTQLDQGQDPTVDPPAEPTGDPVVPVDVDAGQGPAAHSAPERASDAVPRQGAVGPTATGTRAEPAHRADPVGDPGTTTGRSDLSQ